MSFYHQQSHLPTTSTSARRHIFTHNVGRRWFRDNIRLSIEKPNIVMWMRMVVDKRIRGFGGWTDG